MAEGVRTLQELCKNGKIQQYTVEQPAVRMYTRTTTAYTRTIYVRYRYFTPPKRTLMILSKIGNMRDTRYIEL